MSNKLRLPCHTAVRIRMEKQFNIIPPECDKATRLKVFSQRVEEKI